MSSQSEVVEECCICGSKRKRNLIHSSILNLGMGTSYVEIKCKRCLMLGDEGRDRALGYRYKNHEEIRKTHRFFY